MSAETVSQPPQHEDPFADPKLHFQTPEGPKALWVPDAHLTPGSEGFEDAQSAARGYMGQEIIDLELRMREGREFQGLTSGDKRDDHLAEVIASHMTPVDAKGQPVEYGKHAAFANEYYNQHPLRGDTKPHYLHNTEGINKVYLHGQKVAADRAAAEAKAKADREAAAHKENADKLAKQAAEAEAKRIADEQKAADEAAERKRQADLAQEQLELARQAEQARKDAEKARQDAINAAQAKAATDAARAKAAMPRPLTPAEQAANSKRALHNGMLRLDALSRGDYTAFTADDLQATDSQLRGDMNDPDLYRFRLEVSKWLGEHSDAPNKDAMSQLQVRLQEMLSKSRADAAFLKKRDGVKNPFEEVYQEFIDHHRYLEEQGEAANAADEAEAYANPTKESGGVKKVFSYLNKIYDQAEKGELKQGRRASKARAKEQIAIVEAIHTDGRALSALLDAPGVVTDKTVRQMIVDQLRSNQRFVDEYRDEQARYAEDLDEKEVKGLQKKNHKFENGEPVTYRVLPSYRTVARESHDDEQRKRYDEIYRNSVFYDEGHANDPRYDRDGVVTSRLLRMPDGTTRVAYGSPENQYAVRRPVLLDGKYWLAFNPRARKWEFTSDDGPRSTAGQRRVKDYFENWQQHGSRMDRRRGQENNLRDRLVVRSQLDQLRRSIKGDPFAEAEYLQQTEHPPSWLEVPKDLRRMPIVQPGRKTKARAVKVLDKVNNAADAVRRRLPSLKS